jgi:hypothetical protein
MAENLVWKLVWRMEKRKPMTNRRTKPKIRSDEWLMDVTNWPEYCFCPYESDTGKVVLEMKIIQEKCPGKLAGIYNGNGGCSDATWAREHPKWFETYSQDI